MNSRLHGKLAGGNWTRFCQRREQAESIADRRQCAHLLRGQVAEYFEGETLDDLHVQSCSRGGHRLTALPTQVEPSLAPAWRSAHRKFEILDEKFVQTWAHA